MLILSVLSTISQGTIMNSSCSLDSSGSLSPSGSADNVRWQILTVIHPQVLLVY
jgi:hypothetical protein